MKRRTDEHGHGRHVAQSIALLMLTGVALGLSSSAPAAPSASSRHRQRVGDLPISSGPAISPGPGTAPNGPLRAAALLPKPTSPPFRAAVVLVGFHTGVSAELRRAIEHAVGVEGATRLGPPISPTHGGRGDANGAQFLSPFKLRVADTRVLAVVRRLRRSRAVAYAEPDYLMRDSATPNDPSFSLQWGDSNTGQSIPTQESEEILGAPAPGLPGADDGALKAWRVSTGSRSIVIGETDTGVEYTHPDLAANIWSNPGGIGGCTAGTHGYNVLSTNCNPMDTDTVYGGHGTHVAGIMGAVANNGLGVAGMNWQTTILPVKWLNTAGWGETSALIEALQWLVAAKQAGVNVRVVNDSATFWHTAYSQALSNEIDTLGANNILFVTAAGNTGDDNDELSVRRYPCGYDRSNEICVTASNDNDQLPSWANYGPHTVDLAAPGVSIYSTLRNGEYGYLSGGSMAAPQVAGAAALILSVKPSLSATELKADIVEHVDPEPALTGKVIAGGILDVCKALPGCEGQPPPPPSMPVNLSLPAISGAAQTGQTLTASTGSWSENPTAYAYQWQRCDSTGASCAPISGATAQTDTLGSSDVGWTLRVSVTASNSAGSSAPSSSIQTAVVQRSASTFGKTSVGSSSDSYATDRKRVSKYALPTAGSVTKLSIYLAPTGTSGQQVLKGVLYANSSGKPGALLGTTEQLTFKSANAAGWYSLTFPAALKLASGNYWIGVITGTSGSVAGFRYDSVSGSRVYNANTYTSGPSNPFGGSLTTDGEQTSLYATYAPE